MMLRQARPRRALILGVIATLLLQVGCSSYKTLSRKELTSPKAAPSYLVTTLDGIQHTFISLHVEGEILMGTERITTRSLVGEGPEARETIRNRYEEKRIPWSEVGSVQAQASRSQGGLWWAAASIAAGAALFFLLATQDTKTEETPPDGKQIPVIRREN